MSQPDHREPPVLGFFVAVLVFALALVFVGRSRSGGDAVSETGATPAKREAEDPQSPEPAVPSGDKAEDEPKDKPKDRPKDEPRDEPSDGRRTTGGRPSYVPVSDPRKWTRDPSPKELRSKQLEKVADDLLNQCLGETADGCWARFEANLALLTPLKHYIDAEGRLHPISTGERQDQWPPSFPHFDDLGKRFPAPKLKPALREKIRSEWMESFKACLRWESTGMCRMRNDGALEAEFKLVLDTEKGEELLPPKPTCFTRKEIDELAVTSTNPPKKEDPASKNPATDFFGELFGSVLIEKEPLELFTFVMAARKTDASRRELIETKFHLAVMQVCRVGWAELKQLDMEYPHKWAVVVEP